MSTIDSSGEKDALRQEGHAAALAQLDSTDSEDLTGTASRIHALTPKRATYWLDGFFQGFADANNVGGIVNDFSATLISSEGRARESLERYVASMGVATTWRIVNRKPAALQERLRATIESLFFSYVPKTAPERSAVLRNAPPAGLAQTLSWRQQVDRFIHQVIEQIVPQPSGFEFNFPDAQDPWAREAVRLALVSGDKILIIRFRQFD